jgi:hypothetical protein
MVWAFLFGKFIMSDACSLQSSVEQNTRDIQALTASLAELAVSVRSLAEGQKSLGDLVRSQVEHNIEIQAIKQDLRDFQEIFKQIHQRIGALEDYRITTQAADLARTNLVMKTLKYGPIIIAALMAFITLGITLKELKL